jgi:hypothetical protein
VEQKQMEASNNKQPAMLDLGKHFRSEIIQIGKDCHLEMLWVLFSGHKCLNICVYSVDPSDNSGYFFILKFQSTSFIKSYLLPKILVPEGAYKFLAAMDEVIRKLPVVEPTHSG